MLILPLIRRYFKASFLFGVLFCVWLYSFSTLTTKPAYWYDEAINVELARNFADFGKLDLIVAPNTFSGKGTLVGSTGYPVTLSLAGFFRVFGFGLAQARIYMLLWMSALLVALFFIAKKLWGSLVAYGGTLLLATFAPFYGNGRSVMGEIPGFVFFLLSFYFLEQKKYWWSGLLLGLAVISKPSVFVFLIPAYVFAVFCSDGAWKEKFIRLFKIGASSVAALIPWFVIYADEIARGGLALDILNHFTNPYQEFGRAVSANISHNLATFFHSTTLVYFTILALLVLAAFFYDRGFFKAHRSIFLLSAVYTPLALFQYLKNIGYLRYLIAAEFIIFILFLLALPILVDTLAFFCRSRPLRRSSRFAREARRVSEASAGGNPESGTGHTDWIPVFTGMTVAVMVLIQVTHLFWFSDLYPSEKAQKTLAYVSSVYPDATIGIVNVPQIGSFIPSDRKYQYLSTYGLWQFGVNPLLLSPEQMPSVIVADADDHALTPLYEKDTAFSEGFLVFIKRGER